MALIQTTVDDKAQERADAVLARNGLTTPLSWVGVYNRAAILGERDC